MFLNPKSGGNQGAKLMQKFQWLLNPRQVFDLTDGGPGQAIEMFRHVPNIKLLACGGDGTVGWLLSVLDKITIEPMPPVGVLPLGMYFFKSINKWKNWLSNCRIAKIIFCLYLENLKMVHF